MKGPLFLVLSHTIRDTACPLSLIHMRANNIASIFLFYCISKLFWVDFISSNSPLRSGSSSPLWTIMLMESIYSDNTNLSADFAFIYLKLELNDQLNMEFLFYLTLETVFQWSVCRLL